MRGDATRQQHLAALWQIEHWGIGPAAPVNFGDVQAQMDDRSMQRLEAYGDHL